MQAGIWYIGKDDASVIGIGPPTPWEVESELIGAADAALSSAAQKLPENFEEPAKTVFGVPSSWVKDGEIEESRLTQIKNLCTKLLLTPVGFVVLPEAIAHLYKSEEDSSVNAIILGLGNSHLEISVFKLGNLVGTTKVARSVSLMEDVEEGLTRFEGASPLPSRFIVYDGKGGELEEAKEILLGNDWGETNLKFLHTPKVETLSSDRKVLAISLAGAREIGNISHVSDTTKESDKTENLENEEENVIEPEKSITPEEFGFAVGSDVSAQEKPRIEDLPKAAPEVPLRNYLEKTKSLFHSFSSKFAIKQNFKAPKLPKGRPLFIILSILFIIFIGGSAAWWFYPKARITVYVAPRNFQEETNITFNTQGQEDASGGILPGTLIAAETSGNKVAATTGTKIIGDKAKGSVQIQNGTAFPINLNAGAILTSSGNLKFDLDNAASVSAALSPSSPGTATVLLTADSIGAQYNLAKDEVFRVANYPKAEVDGVALADFSGGTSQQISAVSLDDQNGLESALKSELIQNAQSQLESKVSQSQIFVNDPSAIEIVSKDFDRKVGDEANNLKLSLDIKVTSVAADRAKLLSFARSILKDKIPTGFVLRDSQINFKFTFVSQKDGNLTYKASISANFLPEVNLDSIVKQVAGKTPEASESFLSGIPGFTRAVVTLKPRFPGPFGVIPWVKNNVTIEISSEK